MKLEHLFESKVGKIQLAMSKMVSYIEKKIGVPLISVPGVEHFHNSKEDGFGHRFIFSGSTKCIRFNWSSESNLDKAGEIISIDYFDGTKHDPSFSIATKNISLARTLPMIVNILNDPHIGKFPMFAINPTEVMSESFKIYEAKRDDFTAPEALTAFLGQVESGKSLTRSDFIGTYHIVHAGLFDTIMSDFKDSFKIDGRRISKKEGVDLKELKPQILAKAGVVIVTAGGTGEVFLKTDEEAQLEKEDHIPYTDVLEHLEGLITGIISGAFNGLFIAGKGGSLSGSTSINIILNNENKIDDNNQIKNESSDRD